MIKLELLAINVWLLTDDGAEDTPASNNQQDTTHLFSAFTYRLPVRSPILS
jgi:hypothetical protein